MSNEKHNRSDVKLTEVESSRDRRPITAGELLVNSDLLIIVEERLRKIFPDIDLSEGPSIALTQGEYREVKDATVESLLLPDDSDSKVEIDTK